MIRAIGTQYDIQHQFLKKLLPLLYPLFLIHLDKHPRGSSVFRILFPEPISTHITLLENKNPALALVPQAVIIQGIEINPAFPQGGCLNLIIKKDDEGSSIFLGDVRLNALQEGFYMPVRKFIFVAAAEIYERIITGIPAEATACYQH